MFLITILTGCGDSNLNASIVAPEPSPLVLDSNNSKYRVAIKQSIIEPNLDTEAPVSRIGITSHHLPVASDFIGEFYRDFLQGENQNAKTVVVIGPDHPEKCGGKFTTGWVNYDTNFGLVESNRSIVGELIKSKLISNEPECLSREHSIGVQADYIAYLMPEAKIVPLTVSSSATIDETRKIADVLKRFYQEALFVISIDFNHYRTVDQSEVYDQETIAAIESMNVDDLVIDNVDSPPSLRIAVELARSVKASPKIFGYTNSYEFTGQFGNTTSYFNVLFEEAASK